MKKNPRLFIASALFVSLFLAGVVSAFSSTAPDGLEKAVQQLGIKESSESVWTQSPMPDYSVPAVENQSLSTSLSGLAGTVLVFVLGYGLALFVRKKEPAPEVIQAAS